MKSLTNQQNARRRSAGKSVYYFLKAYWPESLGVRCYAERNFAPCPGLSVEAILQSFPEIQRAMPLEITDNPAPGRAQFTVRNPPTDPHRLELQLELVEPRGTRIDAYMAFGEPGVALQESDWILLQTYAVDDYEAHDSRITFYLADSIYHIAERRIAKTIADNTYPDAPTGSYGKIIPYIFGEVKDCPCPRVTGGRTTTLRASIEEDSLLLPVADAGAFAEPGVLPCVAALGDEEIFLATADTSQPGGHWLEAAPDGRGYNGTVARPHSQGEVVLQNLGQGSRWEDKYQFLVARGPVQSVSNVRVGGVALAPAVDYQIVNTHDRDEDGQTETYIELTGALPRKEEVASAAEEITKDGAGSGWRVNGASTAQDPGNAIDGDEETRHVTAAAIAAPESLILALDFQEDLGGCAAQFDGAWLEVDYQAAPGESRAISGQEIPWGAPRIRVLRNGLEVVARDLRKPNEAQFCAYVDVIPGQALSPEAGTLDDSRKLFEALGRQAEGITPSLQFRGSMDALRGQLNDMANQQAAAPSAIVTQKVSLSDAIRANGEAYPRGWEFFSGDVQARVEADMGLATTKILVYDVRFVLRQRAITRRTMRESEAECLADVEGIAEGGLLLEKPAEVIRRLITHGDFFGLPTDGYDAEALEALAPSDWKFARRVDDDVTLGALLSQACWNAGLRWAWDGGRIRFSRIEAPSIAAGVFDFDRSEMFAPTEKRFVPLKWVFNELALYYHRCYTGERAFTRIVEKQDPASAALPWGKRRKTLDAEWIRDRRTADRLADRLLRAHAWRQTVAEIEGPLNWVGPELGDFVRVNDPEANVHGVPGLVVGASFPRPERARYRVAIVNQRLRLWQHDAATYIELHLGAGCLIFVVEGQAAARLTSSAQWRIAGQYLSAEFAKKAQTEMIAYDAGDHAIWFAGRDIRLGKPDRWRAMAITAQGNMLVSILYEDPLEFPGLLSAYDPALGLWPITDETYGGHIYYDRQESLIAFTTDKRNAHSILKMGGGATMWGSLNAAGFVEE